MTALARILALGLTLAIAACATTPPPAMTPPPAKPYDAKTQLESGRRMYEALTSAHPSDWLFMEGLLWNSRFSES